MKALTNYSIISYVCKNRGGMETFYHWSFTFQGWPMD